MNSISNIWNHPKTSAAGLLCLAFYNRLTAVVTRLRGFAIAGRLLN